MRRYGLILSAVTACLIPALGTPSVRADLITTVTPTVTSLGPASFLYSYVVANSPNSTVGVAEFDLSILPGAMVTSINAPTGFLPLFTPGDSQVDFLSSDPSTDIPIGNSAVFSFQSDAAPLMNSVLTRGFDATGTPFQDSLMTLTPSAVPEPSVLLLSALGGLAVFGRTTLSRILRPMA